MNPTLEQKRKRIETLVKVLGLAVVGFIVAPFIFATIKGLIGLVVAAAVALVVINLMPSFAALIANWRLKALKAVAAANPIETLENRYAERQAALLKIRENITKSFSVLQNLYSQIQSHNEKFPNRPSQHLDKYVKLKSLVELRGKKYKESQAKLADFANVIEEKRSDWEIAKTMAEASELAQVGEDFQSKLLQDTALTTIENGLNMAFAELETSLLDEQPVASTTVTVVEISSQEPKTRAALPEKCSPPTLDLGFNTDNLEVESVPAVTNRRK